MSEFIRQKLPVDNTSGFSGVDGFSGLLVLGTTRIDLYTGDIYNVDPFTASISGFSIYDAVGSSGFSGKSGQSGFSGTDGVSGFSGFSGGTSGFSGFSGTGFSGPSGPSGPSGFSGASGFSADSGTSGTSGTSGASGTSGTSGTSGFSGNSGDSGTSGTSGFSAATFSSLKYIFLDIHGAVDDVSVETVTQMPFLVFPDGDARVRWTMIVPDDWISGTNININIFWSLRQFDTNNVFWFTETKSVALGTSVSGANMTSTYTAPGNAVAYRLMSTSGNLFISGASMASNDLLQICVGRSGGAVQDTNIKEAIVHHVRVEYLAKKLQ